MTSRPTSHPTPHTTPAPGGGRESGIYWPTDRPLPTTDGPRPAQDRTWAAPQTTEASITTDADHAREVGGDARLVREVQRSRGALVEIAKVTGLEEPEHLPGWEIAQAVRSEIGRAASDAEFWEDVAEAQTERAIAAEHRFNAVTGRQGNEIGRLRKALTQAGGAGPAQAEVAGWLRTHLGPIDVADQALVLAEEVGEVARAIVKRQQGIRGSRAEWTTALRHEIADTQIALLALAEAEGIDLPTEARRRWIEITNRNPTAARPAARDAA